MWKIDNNKCIKCGGCVSVCPVGALELKEEIVWDKGLCTLCKSCEKSCPVNAIKIKKVETWKRRVGNQKNLNGNILKKEKKIKR